MRRVSAKFVPRVLTDDQKENRVEISEIVPHPPYSPDLAPAHFFLFPTLKTTLKRRHFQTIYDIQENSIREPPTITESAFQEAF
jgi:transposase